LDDAIKKLDRAKRKVDRVCKEEVDQEEEEEVGQEEEDEQGIEEEITGRHRGRGIKVVDKALADTVQDSEEEDLDRELELQASTSTRYGIVKKGVKAAKKGLKKAGKFIADTGCSALKATAKAGLEFAKGVVKAAKGPLYAAEGVLWTALQANKVAFALMEKLAGAALAIEYIKLSANISTKNFLKSCVGAKIWMDIKGKTWKLDVQFCLSDLFKLVQKLFNKVLDWFKANVKLPSLKTFLRGEMQQELALQNRLLEEYERNFLQKEQGPRDRQYHADHRHEYETEHYAESDN